jgi:enoyl-CoA hydratase/carnithine racemase
MDLVGYECRGDVAWLTINRPAQRNALSAEAVRQLRTALERARVDAEVRIIVLTGSGDKHFSAGGDLGEMKEVHDVSDPRRDALAPHRERAELDTIFRELQELGKPTIARVCGLALAGGFGLALGCDFIVASEDAQFGLPEVRVGLWPYIVTESLIRAVTAKVALQLMLTGRRVSAEEGRQLGFVYETVPPDEIDRAIDRLVTQLRAASPQATAVGRTSFYHALDAHPSVRMAMLEYALTVNLGLPDAQEGVAAFLEKRPPRWNPGA